MTDELMNKALEAKVSKALPAVLGSINGLEPVVAANALVRALEIVTLVNTHNAAVSPHLTFG